MTAGGRHAETGSTLIESLVALGLVAFAGLIVASAAVAGLRACRRAATLGPLTALAARELAVLTTQAATATSNTGTLTAPGFATPLTVSTDVHRAGALATLSVSVAGGAPTERVVLTTRALAQE